MNNFKPLLILLFVLFLVPVLVDFISLIKADQCETIIEVFIQENQIMRVCPYDVSGSLKEMLGIGGIFIVE